MAIPGQRAAEDLDDLYTTTWYKLVDSGKVVDNIFTITPLWFWMKENNRLKSDPGGRWIGVNIRYGKNTTIKSFTKGETFDLTRDQTKTQLQYDWKNIGGSLVRYWTDERANAGSEKILDFVQDDIQTCMDSMVDKFEEMLFATIASGSSDINGLGNLVYAGTATAASTDVVGSIDAYTYSWWRNQVTSMSGVSYTSFLENRMRTMYNNCSTGKGANQHPDIIVTTQSIYEYYEENIYNIYQVTSNKLADAGFQTLQFKGLPMVWSPECVAGRMYFLNTEYLHLYYDKNAWFTMTSWKDIPNQLDRAAQVACRCELIITNRARQGIIHTITTA